MSAVVASLLENLTWPIATARLGLRPAILADAEPTWRYRGLEVVSQWITRAPATFTDYQRDFCEPSRLAKTIVVELRGDVIGDLMLAVDDAWAQAEVADQARGVQAELGWVIDPAHGRRGYATEAVRELVRLCFDELGLRRVTANCFADNTASWRLMERIGMRREAHTIRDALHRSGEWLDGYTYALLADERPAS